MRLVELLDEAKERSRAAIAEHNRENEEKGRPFVTFTPEELDAAAGIMGYGAVKYADLKNNRLTNYKCAHARAQCAECANRLGCSAVVRAGCDIGSPCQWYTGNCAVSGSSSMVAITHKAQLPHLMPRFNFDEMLDLAGNTAVFLLYMHAQIAS